MWNCGPCGGSWGLHGCGDARKGPNGGSPNGSDPWFIDTSHGGNGTCHCQHVETLMRQVAALRNQVNDLAISRHNIGSPTPSEGHQPRDPWMPDTASRSSSKKVTLPLRNLGSLGVLATDKPPFDERVAQDSEFKTDGRAGEKWKNKVRNYILSRVPVM